MEQKWSEELDPELIKQMNYLCGCLSLPDVAEYESMSHILADVAHRVIESKALLRQCIKALGE